MPIKSSANANNWPPPSASLPGVDASGLLEADTLRPGDHVRHAVQQRAGLAETVQVSCELPPGWQEDGDALCLSDPAPSDPYPDTYLPDAPARPRLAVTVRAGGVSTTSHIAFDQPPLVLPARSATLERPVEVINLATPRRQIDIELSDIHPKGATPSLTLPEGWQVSTTSGGLRVDLPAQVAPGAV